MVERKNQVIQEMARVMLLNKQIPQNRGFKRGYANQTLFVKNDKDYLIVTQVYVDDIVFGATIDDRAIEFSEEMKKEFKMSMVGELTFFLGL